jgi:hypothetical protein
MPQYNTFRYGIIAKYGRYKLNTGGTRSIGPHVVYRIRLIFSDNSQSKYTTMTKNRISLPPGSFNQIRVRTNDGEWNYTQRSEAPGDRYRFRIRSLSDDGGSTEWVYSDRANLS